MNTRRRLAIALAVLTLGPRVAFAQTQKAPVLIGWINSGSREGQGHGLAAFKEGLAALGWKERSSFVVEERWAESRIERLPALAQELAAMNPVLIVAATLRAVVAARDAAPRTDIVMADGGDPVASGVVKSLSRPGGRITGVTNLVTDVSEKYLEFLLAAAPGVRRVGMLFDPNGLNNATFQQSARRAQARYPVEALFGEAATPDAIEPAIRRMAKDGAQAFIAFPSPFFVSERHRIVELALAHRWPMISITRQFAEAGSLLSYGHNEPAQYRRAAYYVDRILKGTKPADLPIEQPTLFELVVNLKTAKLLGLAMPPEIMVRATDVIQ